MGREALPEIEPAAGNQEGDSRRSAYARWRWITATTERYFRRAIKQGPQDAKTSYLLAKVSWP
jgi:hypothetical protein